MFGWLKIIVLFAICVFVQIYIVPNFEIYRSFPNLILIGLVMLCLFFRFSYALAWSAAGGIVLDLYSPMYFGVYTISFLVIFVMLYFVINKFFTEPIFIFIMLAFFAGSLIMDLFPFIITGYKVYLYLLNAGINAFFGTIIYYLFYGRLRKENLYKLYTPFR